MPPEDTHAAIPTCTAFLAEERRSGLCPPHRSVQRPIPHAILVARSGARVVLAQQHRLHLRFVQNLLNDAELRPPPRMVEIRPARADDFDNPRLNDRPTTVHARPPVDVHMHASRFQHACTSPPTRDNMRLIGKECTVHVECQNSRMSFRSWFWISRHYFGLTFWLCRCFLQQFLF